MSCISFRVGSAHASQELPGRLALRSRHPDCGTGKPGRADDELQVFFGLLRRNLINMDRTRIHPTLENRPAALLLPVYLHTLCGLGADWILSRMLHVLGIMGEGEFIPALDSCRQPFRWKEGARYRGSSRMLPHSSLVRAAGLEPAWPKPRHFKCLAYTFSPRPPVRRSLA